jgi:peptide/nickel transport system substrate-binding protein
MKKGFLVLVVLILALSLGLAACSSTGSSTSPSTQPAPTQSTSAPTQPLATTTSPATSQATATAPASTPPKTTTSPSPTGGPQLGGLLKIITTVSPAILGYPPDADPNTNSLGIAAMESLVYNDQTGSPTPRLATAWQVSADGKTATFTLRKGVKFHDGTDFNAQAVKYILDLSRAKAGTDISKMVASIDVIDDYTVRLNLTQFSNVMFNTLAFSGMVSPTSLQKNGADWARTNIVGTGAFYQADFKRDAWLKYLKSGNYWDIGKPYLDGIEYDIVADATTAQIAFRSGAAQFLLQPTPKVASDLQKQGFTVRNYPGSLWFLAPDSANQNSPFSKKGVREAVEYALDRNAIANAVGYGFLHGVNQLTGPLMTGYNPAIVGRPYNVAKAKQLLADAGYPSGFKTTLYALNTTDNDTLVAIQGYLAAVGIVANIDLCDSGRWIQVRSGSGWVNGLMMTRTGQDPNLAQRLIPDIGGGALYYKNMARPAQWDALLAQATAAQDTAGREKALQQFMQLASDDATVVPLWTGDDIGVLDKTVNCDYLIIHHVQWKPGEAWLSK